MTKPFTYLIKCKPTNQFYYGVKYAKNCDPSDLWNSYFTSSIYVKKLILQYGKDAFEYEIRKIFSSPRKARLWEEKVLKKLNVSNREDFINKYDHTTFDLKSRIWINNGIQTKFIDVLMLEDYLASGWITGRLFSSTHKNKISINAKARYTNPTKNPMFGKKHSQQAKVKNRNSQIKIRSTNPNVGRKITIEQRKIILEKYKNYNPSIPKTPHGKQLTKRGLFCKTIAKEYGVGTTCISNILKDI